MDNHQRVPARHSVPVRVGDLKIIRRTLTHSNVDALQRRLRGEGAEARERFGSVFSDHALEVNISGFSGTLILLNLQQAVRFRRFGRGATLLATLGEQLDGFAGFVDFLRLDAGLRRSWEGGFLVPSHVHVLHVNAKVLDGAKSATVELGIQKRLRRTQYGVRFDAIALLVCTYSLEDEQKKH